MKVSLITLTVLKAAGDKEAKKAWFSWLKLAESQHEDSGLVVECWVNNKTQTFETALVQN